MAVFLKNDKIKLRAIEPEDIEDLYAWENDSEIWEVSNTLTPYSKYILALYIKNSDKDIYESKQLRLVIEAPERGAVGAVDIYDFDPYHNRAGIGILVHRKEDRKHGYATEALKLVTEYCFDCLGMRQVYACIGSDNANSLRLFQKLGFEITGTRKDWLKKAGGWIDEHFLQLLAPSVKSE